MRSDMTDEKRRTGVLVIRNIINTVECRQKVWYMLRNKGTSSMRGIVYYDNSNLHELAKQVPVDCIQ